MAAAQDALRLILRFKQLTVEYHGRGLDAYATGAQAFSESERAVVALVRQHGQAHVRELERLLGASAPAAPNPASYDFTAGQVDGGTPFAGALGAEGGAPYTGADKREFFKLAQLFGDFGVRLMIGQVAALLGDVAAMEVVARMQAAQSRYAAQFRIMRSGTNRAPIDASSTAFAAQVTPWVALPPYGTGRSYDAPGPLGFGGAESDTTSQAFVATLVYGIGLTGPNAPSTPQESESNQMQLGTGPYSPEAFDEPISVAGATKFLARFGVSAV